MGKATLVVQFETENLSNITLKDPQNTVYKVYAKCSQCGEKHKNELHIDPNNEMPLPTKGNRGSTNCVWKCSFCDRKSYIDVLVDSFEPFDSEEGTSFSVTFESRGCDVVDWKLEPETLQATGIGGQVFENVEGKDWGDFDENANESVFIYDWSVEVR